MLEHTDVPHIDQIYYSEVRWLSHGEALKRFVDLFHKVMSFLEDKQTKMLKDQSFKCNLEFLVDVTAYFKELNKKFMGKNQSVNQLTNAVSAFKQTPAILKAAKLSKTHKLSLDEES